LSPLALVAAHLPSEVEAQLPDLGDPAVLQHLAIRPDHLASRERRITQAISRMIHGRGFPGFRWWSALAGDWHGTVLYLDHVDVRQIEYQTPDPLSLEHPVVHTVARLLNMPLPA
jgi:hypothetical protein